MSRSFGPFGGRLRGSMPGLPWWNSSPRPGSGKLLSRSPRPQEARRVLAEREADVAIVLDDFAARSHRPQRHHRFADFLDAPGFPLRGGSEW
jgi:hypothetical protein